MSETTGADEALPWFVKAVIIVAVLVVLLIVAIDLLAFVDAL